MANNCGTLSNTSCVPWHICHWYPVAVYIYQLQQPAPCNLEDDAAGGTAPGALAINSTLLGMPLSHDVPPFTSIMFIDIKCRRRQCLIQYVLGLVFISSSLLLLEDTQAGLFKHQNVTFSKLGSKLQVDLNIDLLFYSRQKRI